MCVSVGKLTCGEVIFFHMMQPLLSADVWCPAESLTSELNIGSNRRGTQINTRSFGEVGKFTGKGCRLVNNVESYYLVSGHISLGNTDVSVQLRACVCGGGREKGCYLIT